MTWSSLCRLDPGVSFVLPIIMAWLGSVFLGWTLAPALFVLGLHVTCSGPVTCTGLLPLGASVVTVDVDVDVVVDVVCRSGRKLWCLGPQISRVVTPQKDNQLIWLSSRS
jgi:hypothetical protein